METQRSARLSPPWGSLSTALVVFGVIALGFGALAGCGDDDSDGDSSTPAAGTDAPGQAQACTRHEDCPTGFYCDADMRKDDPMDCFDDCVFFDPGCADGDEACVLACGERCGLSCDAICDSACMGDGDCRRLCMADCDGGGVPGSMPDDSFPGGSFPGDSFPGPGGGGPGAGSPPPGGGGGGAQQGTCRPVPGGGGDVSDSSDAGGGGGDPPPADMNWAGTWIVDAQYAVRCSVPLRDAESANHEHSRTAELTVSGSSVTATFRISANAIFEMSGVGNNERLTLNGFFPALDGRSELANHNINRQNDISIVLTEFDGSNRASGTISGRFVDSGAGTKDCVIQDGGRVTFSR